MEPPIKKQKIPCSPPEGWTRCHAYMERKSRFCRQEILPSLASTGYQYCGNHCHLVPARQDGSGTITSAGSSTQKRERIPCPVDPTHHIFADMLEKHVEKCPKTVALRRQQEAPFYCRDCNCGGHGTSSSESMTAIPANNLEWAKRVAVRVLQVHQQLFGARPQLLSARDVARLTVRDIQSAIPLCDLSQPELDAGLATAVADNRIKSGGTRHLHQQASLVGHLRRIGALEPLNATGEPQQQLVQCDQADSVGNSGRAVATRIILEMGAGRGMTGLVVAGVSAQKVSTHLTMVERAASRSRAEKFLRKVKQFADSFPTNSNYLNLSAVQEDRIKCDLAHVDMNVILSTNPIVRDAATNDDGDDEPINNAEQSSARELVVVAKHLCGVGTDLALKSLEPIKDSVTACIIATCCHGVCFWEDYVGRDYLVNAMVQDRTSLSSFGAAEFELLRLWSSGTVKDTSTDGEGGRTADPNDPDDDPDEYTRNSHSESGSIAAKALNVTKIVEALGLRCGAQGLGRACQRLIDYGRGEYLRKVIFINEESSNVELLYYVKDSVTPQNAALIAHRWSATPKTTKSEQRAQIGNLP